MRHHILILLLGTMAQSYAETFAPDTIDNWQIYNGTELILAGHASPPGVEFQGTIKTTDLNELVIQFNHCAIPVDEYDVMIEITDDKGKSILTKTFKTNSGTRMIIDKMELGLLTSKAIIIRYQEKRKNGTDKILGKIILL